MPFHNLLASIAALVFTSQNGLRNGALPHNDRQLQTSTKIASFSESHNYLSSYMSSSPSVIPSPTAVKFKLGYDPVLESMQTLPTESEEGLSDGIHSPEWFEEQKRKEEEKRKANPVTKDMTDEEYAEYIGEQERLKKEREAEAAEKIFVADLDVMPGPKQYKQMCYENIGYESDNTIIRWTSKFNKIQMNGKDIQLKGINWFGFETDRKVLFGLNRRSMKSVFDFLLLHKFNAIRLPLSLKFLQNKYDPIWDSFVDGNLNGKTHEQFVDYFIEEAGRYGILVMLDMHRLNDQYIPYLWHQENEGYTEQMYIDEWHYLLQRYKSKWNVFAIDIKNEPYGTATWGEGDLTTDWDKFAKKLSKELLREHPDYKGLVFIEGINYSTDFRNQTNKPIDLDRKDWNERVVWSPHQYGPSVVNLDMFHVPEFPENMPAEWYSHWGFLNDYDDKAVVLGEWGGKNYGLDAPWQKKFTNWLIEECLSDNFYWDLNPESGDTGGLLKSDWFTPETEKIELTNKVQPYPSRLNYNANKKQLCLDPGRYANNECLERRNRKAKITKSMKTISLQENDENEIIFDHAETMENFKDGKVEAKSLEEDNPQVSKKEEEEESNTSEGDVEDHGDYDVVVVRNKARTNN